MCTRTNSKKKRLLHETAAYIRLSENAVQSIYITDFVYSSETGRIIRLHICEFCTEYATLNNIYTFLRNLNRICINYALNYVIVAESNWHMAFFFICTVCWVCTNLFCFFCAHGIDVTPNVNIGTTKLDAKKQKKKGKTQCTRSSMRATKY